MFALTRLILIDSYKANAFQELRLNGHTKFKRREWGGQNYVIALVAVSFVGWVER